MGPPADPATHDSAAPAPGAGAASGPSPAGGGAALHAFAVFAAAWTFALLFVGGLVTSRKAGLAVPDWPLSYGTLNPPGWTGPANVLVEHSHRLFGWGIGMMVIALAAWIQRTDPRPWMRRLGWWVLGFVVLQGVLGGLFRVLLLEHRAAPVHGVLGQAFFCTMVALALFTSRGWIAAGPPEPLPAAGRIRSAALLALAAVFLQVVVGAVFRHWDKIVLDPPDSHFGVLVLVHGATGVVAAGLGLRAAGATLRGAPGRTALALPAILLGAGLLLQVGLGLAAWFTRVQGSLEIVPPAYQFWTATAHQAAGALVMASAVVLVLRVRHLLAPAPAGEPAARAAVAAGGAA